MAGAAGGRLVVHKLTHILTPTLTLTLILQWVALPYPYPYP